MIELGHHYNCLEDGMPYFQAVDHILWVQQKIKNIWNGLTFENIEKIANSSLGKIVIYAAADTYGAKIGNDVGSALIGEMGSDIGKLVTSSEFLILAIGTECLALKYREQSKKEQMCLIAMTIATLVLLTATSPEERMDFGGTHGREIGKEIGGFIGTICGGITLLKVFGSPTVFYDRDHPWNCYAWSTSLFLVTEKIYEAVINKSYWLWVPRKAVCVLLQNIACNSNSLMNFGTQIVEKMRNNPMKKPHIPTIAKMAIETYCGKNAKYMENEFSAYTFKLIFPSLVIHQFEFIQKCDHLLANALVSEIQRFAENSENMASMAISAFHTYATILQNSKDLRDEHLAFRQAILEKRDSKPHKNNLEKIIRGIISPNFLAPSWDEGSLELIGHDSDFSNWEKKCHSWMDYYWTPENIKDVLNKFDEIIKEMETSLVGFPITDNVKINYMNEGIDVYLKHYLLYMLINYNKLESLNPQQEYECLEMLKDLICEHYIEHLVPPAIGKLTHKTISFALETAHKIQSSIGYALRQPEQTSGFNSSIEKKVEAQYF